MNEFFLKIFSYFTVKDLKISSIEDKKDWKITISNQSLIGAAIIKRIKNCPSKICQKINIKVGRDNWMVCSKCMNQYCFLCGEQTRSARHFGIKCHRYTSI